MGMVVHGVTSSDGFYISISMSLQDWTSWCNLMVSSSVTKEVDHHNFNFFWELITSWIQRTYYGHYIRKLKEGRRSEVYDGLPLYNILRHLLKMLMVCNMNHTGLTTFKTCIVVECKSYLYECTFSFIVVTSELHAFDHSLKHLRISYPWPPFHSK